MTPDLPDISLLSYQHVVVRPSGILPIQIQTDLITHCDLVEQVWVKTTSQNIEAHCRKKVVKFNHEHILDLNLDK